MTEHWENLNALTAPLLTWYDLNGRTLPWRSVVTPYRTWVSEIMLQQTRVSAVIPYFERFMAELPDAAALATVPEERLLKLWEGLGYYSRARNLQKAAKVIVSDFGGELPRTCTLLKTLPGIGEVLAQRIVDYREAHGPFRSVEELIAVEGIGEGKLEKLRELVTVEVEP